MNRLILAVLGILLLLPAAASKGPNETAHATFSYGGPALAQGIVTGSCEAGGLLFPLGIPGTVRITSKGGTWEDVETTFNQTVLWPTSDSPIVANSGHRQNTTKSHFPAGNATLTWDHTGRTHIFLPEWPLRARRTDENFLNVHFEAQALLARTPDTDVDGYEYYVKFPNRDAVQMKFGGIGGWNRVTQFRAADLIVTGDLALYLELGRVTTESGQTYQAPPKETKHTTTPPNDVASRGYVESHYILLRLKAARLSFPEVLPDAACGPIKTRVQGNFTAIGATGNVSRYGQSMDFDRKEFSIDGDFLVEYAPHDTPTTYKQSGRVEARTDGEFRAVGIDFVIPQGFGPDILPIKTILAAASAALGLGGLALLFIKGFGLFTRLGRATVEELPSRAVILENLRTQGWIGLSTISRTTGLAEPTVRYHLRVLRREGFVVAQGHRKSRLYCLPAQRNERVPLLIGGRRLDIPEEVRAQPIRQRELLKHLTQLGFGRSVSWYAIKRWVRDGQMAQTVQGREVWYEWRA